ncbi:helix-turn-helix transcriptional regulator [Nocardia rhamnosiphila]|uniref:LuxR C-terminal-related transcriptional regulator n=1 Tax=Nocardia rhamnosiphila TaxID=426716 RepID=A0ABV2WYR9_9NOCA
MTRRVQHGMGSLPAEVTSLVGRRVESAEVRRLLGKSRMVTLTGPGGVGKTRLAVHVARRVSASFGDGVCFVPLSEVTRPDLVVPTIMSVLDPGPGMQRDLAAQVGEKRLLLVLDNCEHLTAACAEVTAGLLAACPQLTVLATSREALRIAGEVVVAVRPLAVPRGLGVGRRDRARSDDAVGLFVERARQANPELAVDGEVEHAVVELCHRLDGLPLAIELAAAATRVLPIAALSAQTQPLTPLAQGLRSAPIRHQSLRATIACSYDLCSPPARRLWERMSVLRGGTSLEVVQQVCADETLSREDIAAALVELTSKSVVEFDGSRYRMLETIRYFGAEELAASGQEVAMREAHLVHITALTDELERSWCVGDQRQVVRSVRDQWANVRAALDFCLTDPTRAEAGLRITRRLYGFWVTSVPMREGRNWLDRFLAVDLDPSEDRACALWIAGLLTTLDGDVPRAELLIEEGIAVSRALDDQADLAHSLQGLAFCRVLRGRVEESLAMLGEAVGLERSLPAPNLHLGRALTTQGIALCAADRAEQAAAALEEARAIQIETGDDFMGSWSDVFLGLAACRDNQLERADGLLTGALERKSALGDTLGVSLALEFLGWVVLDAADADRGARLLAASEVASRTVGPHLVGFTRLLQWHGEYRRRARRELGAAEYESAIKSAQQMSVADLVDYALGRLGSAESDHGMGDELPLTPRERQIAVLVSEGKTNKEIAAELVIAHRTVDSHVENILVKLGFSSRVQIAALVARG